MSEFHERWEAMGFDSPKGGQVTLFLTESFTFRVLNPAACVFLPLRKTKGRSWPPGRMGGS